MSETNTTPNTRSEAEILAKVQKLLAHAADSGVTPEEAKAFAEKAQELISTYAISEALLNFEDHSREEPTTAVIFIQNPYIYARLNLISGIARVNHCLVVRGTPAAGTFYLSKKDAYAGEDVTVDDERGIRLVTFKNKVLPVYLTGFPSDIRIVQELYTHLTLQVTRELLSVEVPSYENTKSFRNDFIHSFGDVIHSRLLSVRRKVEEEARAAEYAAKAEARADASVSPIEHGTSSASVSLALIDKSKRVKKAQKERFASLRSVPGGTRGNSRSGSSAGAAAGARADLGGRSVGGSRGALGR